MWPYSWTHVGTPSDLGHMDRVATAMPSQAHAGAAQEAPNIGQWEGQDVPLVRLSSCTVKGGIPSSRRYLPTYLPSGVGVPPRPKCFLRNFSMWESFSLSRASSIKRSTSSSYEWVLLFLSEVERQSSHVRWGILLMSHRWGSVAP